MTDWRTIRETVEGALSLSEMEHLAAIANESGATNALEVGHWKGLSTVVLLESLPDKCALTTIDHHAGDYWIRESVPAEFVANITPHLHGRPFLFANADMIDAIPMLVGPFDFVFYDADHFIPSIARFWSVMQGRLADRCTLVFDDADWEEQSSLFDLARADGFRDVTSLPFHRGKGDKNAPETFTLARMVR